jgi:hypothetical protein
VHFWRVIAIGPPRLLELTAEMKLAGTATLTFEVVSEPSGDHGAGLIMTARDRPRGLLGIAYWYSVLPLHKSVFRGMIRGLAREAERMATGSSMV